MNFLPKTDASSHRLIDIAVIAPLSLLLGVALFVVMQLGTSTLGS